jgi:hypothetical protein
VLALGSGYLAAQQPAGRRFVICVAASIPSFILLVWLQRGDISQRCPRSGHKEDVFAPLPQS